jgi:hypothetical protein
MLAVHPPSAQMARENRLFLGRAVNYVAVQGIRQFIDPGRVLADAGLADLIDLAEPAWVIFSAVLHFADAAAAREITGAFARVIVPGSYLIISVGSGNRTEGETFTSAYTAARVRIHSPEEIGSFFGGLELVPPRVVAVRAWQGDAPALDLEERTATFLGGVARKP